MVSPLLCSALFSFVKTKRKTRAKTKKKAGCAANITYVGQAFSTLLELTKVREELGSNTFMGLHMSSRLYAMLPTKANKQLDWYTAGFRDFNLRIAASAEEVRSTLTHLLPSPITRYPLGCDTLLLLLTRAFDHEHDNRRSLTVHSCRSYRKRMPPNASPWSR